MYIYICTNSYTDVLLHAHTYIHILMIDYFDYSLEFQNAQKAFGGRIFVQNILQKPQQMVIRKSRPMFLCVWIFFLCPTWLCSGCTHGSVLRSYYWWAQGIYGMPGIKPILPTIRLIQPQSRPTLTDLIVLKFPQKIKFPHLLYFRQLS